MGLDNLFYIRKKGTNDFKVNIGYFRNYYELNDFFGYHGIGVNSLSDETFNEWFGDVSTERPDWNEPVDRTYYDEDTIVRLEDLKLLRERIEPLYKEYMKLPYSEEYYDEHGVPEEVANKFYGNKFDANTSSSAFALYKLKKLYHIVNMLIDCLEDKDNEEYFVHFVRSW